ncbi:MAG: hypothetical protein LCH96_08615 [Actinobacteria bacterium]|nr:hypothetical protein [Actinomycetota bacterium]
MGLFERFTRRGRSSDDGRPVVDATPDDAVTADELRDAARQAVLPGFLGRDAAVESVRESFELEAADPRPAAVVDEVWRQRKLEETSWSGTSDYDRLRAAFDDLQADGVVARMNFACCNTCGTDEIDAERTPVDADGYGFRESQYTFFHQQDADRLAESPTRLFLTYSAWRAASDLDPELLAAARAGDADARAQVIARTDAQAGERVAAALRNRGLRVEWDGDPQQRLEIVIDDWRKPLPA